jgi:hypothetical protein
MRFSVFALLVIFIAACKRPPVASVKPPPQVRIAQLREGDILFQKLPCGSLCDAIIETTPCSEAHAFNHCGVFRYAGGQPVVVEAIGTRVQQTPLATFMQRDTAARLSVGRVADGAVAESAAKKSGQYLGRPYDDAFVPGDSALYCSELIWETYQGPTGPLFTLQPMTFRSGGRTHPGWVEYYMKLGVAIPEGEPGINPCGIAGSEAVSMMAIPKTELRPTQP